MSIVECGNGHVYDADQYAACPYCNGNRTTIDFTGGRPASGGRTVAPETMRPSGAGETVSPFGPSGELKKTVAPESYRKRMEKENRTVGIFKKKYNIEPVVGWLVCVEGPEKGKDFHLWAKINTIGRSEQMDVCVAGDMTISKENHARLAYDPKHNNFRLIPGESTNNIYLNEEPVYLPALLTAYDSIELGESRMLFVPFCGERFRWDDRLTKKEDEEA
ncbi:MAG: FHA domain-containing protein [Eubacteriales bacterium]|nr:FHA domain-containing protein [Eubacteriales bacterium]